VLIAGYGLRCTDYQQTAVSHQQPALDAQEGLTAAPGCAVLIILPDLSGEKMRKTVMVIDDDEGLLSLLEIASAGRVRVQKASSSAP
jgi:hypothetical protein